MSDKKVLMITKVTAVWSRMKEFHEYWHREALPFWTEHGAKHIGSYTGYLGGNKNEIIRVFEFENLEHYHRWMETRESLFDSENGESAMTNLFPYLETIEETAWISAYDPE